MATIKQLKDHDTNENIYPLTYINAVRDTNNNTVLELLDEKQDKLTFDTTPTSGSNNPVTSGGIKTVLDKKMDIINLEEYCPTLLQELAPTMQSGTSVALSQTALLEYKSLANIKGKYCIMPSIAGNEMFKLDQFNHGSGTEERNHTHQSVTYFNDVCYGPYSDALGTEFNNPELYSIMIVHTYYVDNDWQHTENNDYRVILQNIKLQNKLEWDTTPTANSTNPVTSSGIKTALDVKADKTELPLIVLYDGGQCDTSIADIYAAFLAGRNVEMNYGNIFKLSLVQCGEGGALFSANFSDQSIGIKGTILNGVDTWEFIIVDLQERLNSGTNIKTVNNNSLLGSGDVQVGDITGEELEMEIEELESTLLTDALRKSEQVLLPAEKTQVLTNLGIADVAKESNLKTINGASIVGTGNIEVLSVNAGDIDVMQATGTSTTGVMSQKAVTDMVIRANSNDTTGLSESMITKLTRLGWEFGKKLNGRGVAVDDENYCVTGFIPVGDIQNHSLTLKYMFNGASIFTCFYNASKQYISEHYIVQNANLQKTITYTRSGDAYVRMTCSINNIAKCLIKDETTEEYIFIGNDYLYDLYKDNLINYEYLMSQSGATSEDLAGNSQLVRKMLEDEGWVFDCAMNNSASLVTATGFCVTSYIPVTTTLYRDIMKWEYGFPAQDHRCLSFYKSDKSFLRIFVPTTDNELIYDLTPFDNMSLAAYFRMTLKSDQITSGYLKNETTNIYIWQGSMYIAKLCAKLSMTVGGLKNFFASQDLGFDEMKYVSQKKVTEELNQLVHNNQTPTYLRGTLIRYKLDNFPELDPRFCDGVSIVVDMNQTTSGRFSFLEIIQHGQNNSATFFALAKPFSNIFCGLMKSYFQTLEMGTSFNMTPYKTSHLVITFEFVTGTTRIYNNGVLATEQIPESYSYADMKTYLDACYWLTLAFDSNTGAAKTTGIAMFGHALTDDEVTEIFGNGCEETCGELVPTNYQANWIAPHYFTCGVYQNYGTITKDGNDTIITINSGQTYLYFGLTGVSNVLGNCIYEFDFEVLSGTAMTYNRGMLYNNNYYKCYIMTDSNGNDVSYNSTLTQGMYHVVCRPNNMLLLNDSNNSRYNAGAHRLLYIFGSCSSDFSIKVYSNLKVLERGAAVVCCTKNYRGDYWELYNGTKLYIRLNAQSYDTSALTVYYDIYKSLTVKYVNNILPQFNGQMAVDSTNGRIYVGYLTGTGGTWKQINNS